MRNAHPVAEVRRAEQALMARVPEGTLMQRAAAGLAAACADLLGSVYGARIAVLAGSGDNGGDALHAGALLARRGAVVTAVTASDRHHRGGADALLAVGGRVMAAADGGERTRAVAEREPTRRPAATPDERALRAIRSADLVIDGLLGIGGRGGLREPAASLAAAAAESDALVVAVDLPSGIDADSGEVTGAAVQADATVTFGTWKPGLLIDPGAAKAGATRLVDIGLGPYLGPAEVRAVQGADVADWLPRLTRESDKYRRGVLGVLAGSPAYTGAAVLAVGGAIRGGAGMVRLVSCQAAATVVRQHWPEAVITLTDAGRPAGQTDRQLLADAGRVQAWVAGPGMGTGAAAASLLGAALAADVPVLVDADGLTVLAAHPELLAGRSAPTLITPHAGELGRLTGADRADIEARRLRWARQAAADLGVTVLLKGSTTVIAAPGQPVLVNPTGTPWLATAGSGDVLSGLAGALLAQGLDCTLAAAAAAYLHGMAARLGADGAPVGASDLLVWLPAAIRAVTAGAAG